MHTSQKEKEFVALLERHQQAIDGVCLRYSDGDAFFFHELRQECALALWLEFSSHGLRHFRGESSEATWIGGIARHAIAHYLRSPRHRPIATAADLGAAADVPAADSQADGQALFELAESLDMHERALMAHLLAGESYSTIARAEGITESAARKRMERMIKKLKKTTHR